MRLKNIVTIIVVVPLFVMLFLLAKQAMSPKIIVDAASPVIVDSGVGEQQAILIALKNAKSYGTVSIKDADLILDKNIELIKKGIILEDGGSVIHPFLLRGNANWENAKDKVLTYDKTSIKPYETAKLVFLTKLIDQAALIEGAKLTFTYLGREYSGEIPNYKIVLLAKTACPDLKEFITESLGSNFQGGGKKLESSTLTLKK